MRESKQSRADRRELLWWGGFDLAIDFALAFDFAVKALLHPIFLGGSQNWRFHRQFWWGVRLISAVVVAVTFRF